MPLSKSLATYGRLAEVQRALRESFERSYRPRLPELSSLRRLEAHHRKPYIRSVLYPARLIYTWDNLAVDSNDRAVEYLHQARVPGLDLKPIDLALACRQEKCAAAEVFAQQEGIVNVYSDTTPGREFVDRARAALSPDDVARATEVGRRLTIKEAVDLARTAETASV